MRVAMRTEKELAKAGQDRAIPLTVATTLAKDIKDFLDHESPLMLLMSTPGIKKVRGRKLARTFRGNSYSLQHQ